jgi:hypothetical protein
VNIFGEKSNLGDTIRSIERRRRALDTLKHIQKRLIMDEVIGDEWRNADGAIKETPFDKEIEEKSVVAKPISHVILPDDKRPVAAPPPTQQN